MSVLNTGGMVTEKRIRTRQGFQAPRKKKPALRDIHPKNPMPDYKHLRKLFPEDAPAELRAKLDSLRCACQSNEAKFCASRREAWFARQRGQRHDRIIRAKQRLTKTDMLFELFLLRWELDQIWTFLQAKSKEDYPEKLLPLGQFTTFDSSI